MCSFDILKDDLGGPRSSFPHAMYVVAGTQAQHANQNYIALMRLSDINQGRHGSKARNEDDDDMSDSDDEDAPPQIHTNRVAHHGGVNRMRCMPQQPAVVASWGDTGLVQVGCPAEDEYSSPPTCLQLAQAIFSNVYGTPPAKQRPRLYLQTLNCCQVAIAPHALARRS